MDASGSPLGYVILAVFLLLLLSAFFSGAETALFAVNRLRMRRMAEEGRRRPALILRLLEQPGRVLTALLVGNNIANVTASVLATALLVAVLGPQLGPIYAIIILTLVILIIGEITPKTFAAKYADRLAILVSRPVHYFTVALTPVIWLLSRLSDLLVRPLGGRVNLASPLVTEEEIRLLVKMGEEVGVLQEEERQMIHSIFEFGDTVAREVMVPRIDMVSVEVAEPIETALGLIAEKGHSRIPVYEGRVDQI
ncbi:MAG: DUF21 domain-containing protein, partial [Armatimonadetes bacterium]|nr:DUF21 domain-containing protein [Armatimonadota bacterium]